LLAANVFLQVIEHMHFCFEAFEDQIEKRVVADLKTADVDLLLHQEGEWWRME
jgi:hypothetical protein